MASLKIETSSQLCSQSLNPQGMSPVNHSFGAQVWTGAGLCVWEEIHVNNSCPYREQKHNFSVIQLVAQSAY
jgi:hypothetical protein